METTKDLPPMQAGTPGIHRYDLTVNERPMGSVAIYDVLSSDKTSLTILGAFIAIFAALLGVFAPRAFTGPTSPSPVIVIAITPTAIPLDVGQPFRAPDPTAIGS